MNKIYAWILCTFLSSVLLGLPTPVIGQHLKPVVSDTILDTALWTIGLTQADLSIRGDILDDVDRFTFTKKLLEEPTLAMALVPKFDHLTGVGLLEDALQVMDDDAVTIAVPETPMVGEWPQALGGLIQALAVCQKKMDVVFDGFSVEKKDAFKSMIHLVDPGIALSEARSDSFISLGRRVNRQALVRAAIDLMKYVDGFVASSPILDAGVFDTAVGRVVVGDIGTDVYSEPAVLVIDLGGNDHYVCQATNLSVVIDLGGDDLYEGASGSGVAGVGLIVDVEGQDRYLSEGIGQGVGIGGVGVLVDLEGDDVYQVGVGGQGFGLYGVGVLCDRMGNDQYGGALLVQGVGAPGGVGILADALGGDTYRAGGKYKDFREDGQFYQSMAQGFGYGVRPLASGGVGILVDDEGDDRYQVDYFGQGTGFWGSVGMLIDLRGKDQYQARRYGQGCGVHLAVGLLVDKTGNDIYDLWGVGQGCGHDLAAGHLIDLVGSDIYRSTWLAQGVGSANGVGWLDDYGGDDHFEAKREDTQGFGGWARDYGSIGLLIDRGGLDHYRLGLKKGAVWSVGDYGVGIDWPLLGRIQ